MWTYLTEDLDTGDQRRTVTDPAGAQTVTTTRADGSILVQAPNGEQVETVTAPDPRFGLHAPLVVEQEERTPGGRLRRTTRSRTVAEDATGVLSTLTDTVTINNRTRTRKFTNDAGPGGTITSTTPRSQVLTTKIDDQGRTTQLSQASTDHPVVIAYDERGRVSSITQGRRSQTFGFDDGDRLISRTNALGSTVGFGYDAGERLRTITSDTGSTWTWGYDADGQRTSAEMPLGQDYGFGYEPDSYLASITLPDAGGAAGLDGGTYAFTRSADRLLKGRTNPGGTAIVVTSDEAGRLATVDAPETTRTYSYFGDTQQIGSVTWNEGGGAAEQTIAYTYDGSRPASVSFSGGAGTGATGTFTYVTDNDLQASQWSIAAGTSNRTYALNRDTDRLLTAEGPWTITRDPASRRPTAYVDGQSKLAQTHDGYGQLDTRTLTHGTDERYRLDLTRDDAGRVTERHETVGGATVTTTYGYDDDDRLVSVTRNGAQTTYSYDANGNRTSGGAAYDGQDRITAHGSTAFTFDADGFLAGRGVDEFEYGRFGELLRARVGGDEVTYDYDGWRRRVRRQRGTDSTQYLYGNPDDPFQITATIDENDVLTTLFYDEEGALRALERGANRYTVGSDQVGTPRVVTDSAGAVVKVVERDAWGVPISDGNPAFELPIGLAGGIDDPATGLVRFGLRDYDPQTGRWTARDPAFFDGSPFNLYAYVANDPVSHRDPTGLKCSGVSGYLGAGGGIESCDDAEGGASVCVEYGFGVGAGVDFNPWGQALRESGDSSVFEISGEILGTGVSGSLELDDCGRWKRKGGLGFGPFTTSLGDDGVEVKGGFGTEAGIKSVWRHCFSTYDL